MIVSSNILIVELVSIVWTLKFLSLDIQQMHDIHHGICVQTSWAFVTRALDLLL